MVWWGRRERKRREGGREGEKASCCWEGGRERKHHEGGREGEKASCCWEGGRERKHHEGGRERRHHVVGRGGSVGDGGKKKTCMRLMTAEECEAVRVVFHIVTAFPFFLLPLSFSFILLPPPATT